MLSVIQIQRTMDTKECSSNDVKEKFLKFLQLLLEENNRIEEIVCEKIIDNLQLDGKHSYCG